MKNYIKPSIKVAMFSDERVNTTEEIVPAGNALSNVNAVGLNSNIANKQNVIQKSIRMNEVMKFN